MAFLRAHTSQWYSCKWVKLHTTGGQKGRRKTPAFHNPEHLGASELPPNGVLVHHRVTPVPCILSSAPIYKSCWRNTMCSKVSCLGKQHDTLPRLTMNQRPSVPRIESSARYPPEIVNKTAPGFTQELGKKIPRLFYDCSMTFNPIP